jgi:hypothetical protein
MLGEGLGAEALPAVIAEETIPTLEPMRRFCEGANNKNHHRDADVEIVAITFQFLLLKDPLN